MALLMTLVHTHFGFSQSKKAYGGTLSLYDSQTRSVTFVFFILLASGFVTLDSNDMSSTVSAHSAPPPALAHTTNFAFSGLTM